MEKLVRKLKSLDFPREKFVHFVILKPYQEMVSITINKEIQPIFIQIISNREYIRSTNIIPFHTIGSYLSGALNVSPIIAASNILGNIIFFVPLGIYLQLLKKSKKI